MIDSKLKLYWKDYSAKLLRLDNFALAKMGLIQSRTILKIENYLIVCAPYQISMKKAFLFVVLNKEEIPFFKKYLEKLAALKLTFQKSLNGIPLKFFVWVIIKGISSVKGKENMCLIEVVYKNCPESLINIIGQFFELYRTLWEDFLKRKGKKIYINRESSMGLNYNNFMECFIGNRVIEVKLLSLSVNCLIMEVPGSDPLLKEGYEFKSKLYFKSYRFFVKGRAEKITLSMNGFLKVTYNIQFVPELVEIIRAYYTSLEKQEELSV